MEFKLADSLSNTLVSYDATRKKEAAKAKRSINVHKKKHQFGNINYLIPFEVVSAENQQKAADHINKSLCENRVYDFYTGKCWVARYIWVCGGGFNVTWVIPGK